LVKRGSNVPLVADIHYNPQAAEIAAEIVEKVRINPGNYVDRNVGKVSYTDSEYNAEIEKIGERMANTPSEKAVGVAFMTFAAFMLTTGIKLVYGVVLLVMVCKESWEIIFK
jgi:4-hydroxy-3-methylbut-2-en-1-yl diphosphate synthase IspG/GcpE